jgi:hypothetical protein
MSSDHMRFKFSITCQTDDIAVLHCLRSLCQFSECSKKKQIGWGGTGEADWRANSGRFTLRFTDPQYRQRFIDEANRLLAGHWSIVKTNDNDPATPWR